MESQSDRAAFLTLTTKPGLTWPQIMRAFSKFIRALRRRSPDLAYAAIKQEGLKRGMKHLHVLLLNWEYRDQRDLSALWARYTDSPIVDIRKLRGSNATGYVAHYSARANANWRKCVTYSSNWPAPEPPPQPLTIERHFDPPVIRPGTLELDDGTCVEHIAPGCHCLDHILPKPNGPPKPDRK
jgi:hypothetical protein